MDEWDRAVDKIIRQAMEEGRFDNLPGKGRPLDLGGEDEDETWAANRILKNADLAPDWIEERREIVTLMAQARARLARSWAWRCEALARGEAYAFVADEWQRALARFREAADEINRRIRTYNLKAPTPLVHLPVLDVEREVRRAQSGTGT